MNRNAIRAFALGIITGSFLTSGIVLLSAPAKAEPNVAAGELYDRIEDAEAAAIEGRKSLFTNNVRDRGEFIA